MIWKSDGPAAAVGRTPLTCISLAIRKCQSKRRGRDSPPRLGEISWGRLQILSTSRVIIQAWRVKKGAERGRDLFGKSIICYRILSSDSRPQRTTDGRTNDRTGSLHLYFGERRKGVIVAASAKN